MNFSQKLGLFVLIVISLAYIYFSFFSKDFQLPEFRHSQEEEPPVFNPVENNQTSQETPETQKPAVQKTVKIFILDKSGNLRLQNGKNQKVLLPKFRKILKSYQSENLQEVF